MRTTTIFGIGDHFIEALQTWDPNQTYGKLSDTIQISVNIAHAIPDQYILICDNFSYLYKPILTTIIFNISVQHKIITFDDGDSIWSTCFSRPEIYFGVKKHLHTDGSDPKPIVDLGHQVSGGILISNEISMTRHLGILIC